MNLEGSKWSSSNERRGDRQSHGRNGGVGGGWGSRQNGSDGVVGRRNDGTGTGSRGKIFNIESFFWFAL